MPDLETFRKAYDEALPRFFALAAQAFRIAHIAVDKVIPDDCRLVRHEFS
jgi:hypothetical protein